MKEVEIGLSHEGRDRQRQRDQKVKAWKITHQTNVIPKQARAAILISDSTDC